MRELRRTRAENPVAVDLAKSACRLESGGAVPIDWLDDNIVIGNALAGDLPPALTARINSPSPLVILDLSPADQVDRRVAAVLRYLDDVRRRT
jgi:hypothetical protein